MLAFAAVCAGLATVAAFGAGRRDRPRARSIAVRLLGPEASSLARPWRFVSGTLASVSIFLLYNLEVYRNPLGGQSFQVLDRYRVSNRIAESVSILGELASDLLTSFPLAAFLICAAFLLRNRRLDVRIRYLVLTSILFLGGVPILLPTSGGKQWGPRFILVLMPMLSVIAAAAMREVLAAPRSFFQRFTLALGAVTLAGGVYLNTGLGSIHLANDYRDRVLPALRFVRSQPLAVVVVANQHVGQELESILPGKALLRAANNREMDRLAAALYARGERRFLFIAQVFDGLPDRFEVSETARGRGMRFATRGHYGIYAVWEVEVT
jgi:hypothetical protein